MKTLLILLALTLLVGARCNPGPADPCAGTYQCCATGGRCLATEVCGAPDTSCPDQLCCAGPYVPNNDNTFGAERRPEGLRRLAP
jgi:hypothetical protein